MGVALKFEINMKIWGREVNFIFSNLLGGGYSGQIVFPEAISISDIILDVWENQLGQAKADFPFGDSFKLELESVMAVLKTTKQGDSIVMFDVQINGIILSIYFVKNKDKDEEATVFQVKPQKSIQIDTLPEVNTKLPNPIKTDISFYIASGSTSFTIESKKFNFNRGFAFDCLLDIPEVFSQSFNYTYAPKQQTPTARSVTSATPEDAESSNEKIKWKKVEKKIGSIATIHRIGLGYANKKVAILFDLDANFSVLQMSLIGLRLNLDLNYISYFKDFGSSNNKFGTVKKFIEDAVSIGLDGLGVGLETSAFTIAGLLARQKVVVQGKEYNQYIGGITIKTKSFTIIGLGAYGKIAGYQSFFLYAYLGVPIGGPPFFFVNGLAIGFGYNRQVKIPSIEGVADFPLVKIVMGSPQENQSFLGQMTQMIPMITEAFPPQKNHLFFAVGIKFTSFKLIDGFVLLLVSIGGKLRIDVLGLFVLAMPKEKPVAVIEVALKVTFIPEDGVLKVDGRITDNSFLFDKKAKLQGGFAFYAWFMDAEENGKFVPAGDFVLTIGGYHPSYKRPSYYPSVPRFGLNWRVNDKTTIKAQAYFALTATAVMAGGELSAVYKSGNLQASFKIWANFLIQWKPFYYDISIGIEFSVSYTCRIKILWKRISKTFSLSLGADLHIWGPEFAGKATLKCWLFKITIHFGASGSPSTQKLKKWSEFQSGFLPKPTEVISINILDGVVNTQNSTSTVNPTVNSKELAIKIDTSVPVSQMSFGDTKHLSVDNFGIYPVQSFNSAFSKLVITLKYNGGVRNDLLSHDFDISEKNYPAALWSQKDKLGLNENKKFINALSGTVLKSNLPEEASPFTVNVIPDFDITTINNGYNWGNPDYFSDNDKSFKDQITYGIFNETFDTEILDFKDFGYRATIKKI
jgi:hypothetical protein